MDGYEYPTEEVANRIKGWTPEDGPWESLMDYVKEHWWMPDWGWFRSEKRHRAYKGGPLARYYKISTGGWSGNELLIDAMQENWMFWVMCWMSSRKGGHYEFRV